MAAWWECTSCKSKQPATATVCLACAAKAPADPPRRAPPRDQLPSFSGLIDTKSFTIPVRRQVIWIWVAMAFGLPVIMSLAYFAIAWFGR